MKRVVAGAVVAGAVVGVGEDGVARLLLAQRDRPAALAGLWELPGGKVESGESPAEALRRELDEELAIDTVVGVALSGVVMLTPNTALSAYWVEPRSGEVLAREHRAVRWVGHDELLAMVAAGHLVAADTLWVSQLAARLTERT